MYPLWCGGGRELFRAGPSTLPESGWDEKRTPAAKAAASEFSSRGGPADVPAPLLPVFHTSADCLPCMRLGIGLGGFLRGQDVTIVKRGNLAWSESMPLAGGPGVPHRPTRKITTRERLNSECGRSPSLVKTPNSVSCRQFASSADALPPRPRACGCLPRPAAAGRESRGWDCSAPGDARSSCSFPSAAIIKPPKPFGPAAACGSWPFPATASRWPTWPRLSPASGPPAPLRRIAPAQPLPWADAALPAGRSKPIEIVTAVDLVDSADRGGRGLAEPVQAPPPAASRSQRPTGSRQFVDARRDGRDRRAPGGHQRHLDVVGDRAAAAGRAAAGRRLATGRQSAAPRRPRGPGSQPDSRRGGFSPSPPAPAAIARSRAKADRPARSKRLRAYPKTDGDCPDFAEPAEQNGTVPFSGAVFG